MQVLPDHSNQSTINNSFSNRTDFDLLIEQSSEPELWRLLQEIVSSKIELSDDTIRQLNGRMQGFMFVQDCVVNREVRIEFARSSEHMNYLRDAAGSRNVWIDDETFTQLVNEDDAATLACFARSEQMKPHHLFYIAHKLVMHPHRQEMLATADEARIALKKAVESQGQSRNLALIRLGQAAINGSASVNKIIEQSAPGAIVHSRGDPKSLWQAYQNLKQLNDLTLRELFEAAGISTAHSARAGRAHIKSLH